MTSETARLHAIVHGRVQGVSFRHHTQRRAQALALRGWVRNCDDGTVETEAQGERSALDALVSFLKEGPVGAHVRSVDLQWIPLREGDLDFEIRF